MPGLHGAVEILLRRGDEDDIVLRLSAARDKAAAAAQLIGHFARKSGIMRGFALTGHFDGTGQNEMTKARDTKKNAAKARTETVAAIDVGSNSLRLLVAQIEGKKIKELDRLTVPVMIGRDTFSIGRISNATTRETAEVLKGFARVLKEYGVDRYRAIATTAVREAFNRDTFLDAVESASGLSLDVIEPIEETRLVHQVVRRTMGPAFSVPDRTILVLALGAGSSEITVFQGGRLIFTETGRFGTLRLIETLASAASDRLLYQRLSSFVLNVASTLERVHGVRGVDTFVVVNTDLYDLLDRNSWTGVTRQGKLFRVTRGAFRSLASRVTAATMDERAEKFRLGYDSAETIPAAIVAVESFLETTGARAITLPSVSVLDSLLMDVMRSARRGESDPQFERDITASAVSIGRKYRFDEAHSLHVEKLSLMLFDQLKEFCGLRGEYRLLLRVSAILHDIGMFISTRSHHKHSQYIIMNSEILGIAPEDHKVIGEVARYHRRATPRAQHVAYWALPQESRVAVSKIASILRIADALDRNHSQEIVSVKAVPMEEEVLLEVKSRGNLLVDEWALESKADLFRDIYGLPVVLARARE